MKNLLKNFLIIIAIFLVVSSVFSIISSPTPKETITLSQLTEKINESGVEKIIVQENDLQIYYKDGVVVGSTKESESSLTQSLTNYGVDTLALQSVQIENKSESGLESWIMPILISLLPILLIGAFFFFIMRQAKAGSMQAFDFTKARARLFGAEGHSKERITFKDVAGLAEAKEELLEIVDFLKSPEKFLQMGARIPRGVLMMGAPGTGKTLLARAVAGEAHVPFFHMSGSEFVEMFVGVGAGRVRDLFNTAKKAAPSIIFIDELDAIGRQRGTGLGGGHDEREQTLNQILVEMDGFDRDTNVIVMAATNRPDVLDSALLRPGRFDRRVTLDLPDAKDREAILNIHCKGKPLAENINIREIAERTPGFSGADLANVVNEAALLAARKNKKQVFQTELLDSIEKVLLGPERKSHILSVKEKEIAAYHEAGHAIVGTFADGGDPIRKISIVSRGMAAGYTIKMPTEERRIQTKTEFVGEMAALLGGRVAEKMKFNEYTTGASNDLEKTSQLARKLVKEYGMSSLGPVSYGEKEEMIFLGKDLGEQRNYSEKVAAEIDQEVERFVLEAEEKARKILLQKKTLLEKLSKRLIEKETIEREEFEEIIGKKKEEKPVANKSSKLKIKVTGV
jgi:cell division protease FtsH